MTFKHRDLGFTLVETILVLGIVSLIMGAIWLGYSYATHMQKSAMEEQQISDQLEMARSYLNQFNENCTSIPTCPANLSIPVYNANGSRDVITDLFVNNNLLPASAQGTQLAPDGSSAHEIVTAYGNNSIATAPSVGNPYGSGPLISIDLYNLPSTTACVDIVSTWAGSPARVQKSGLVAVLYGNNVWTNAISIQTNNAITLTTNSTTATSLQTSGIQTVCPSPLPTGTIISLIFKLNP